MTRIPYACLPSHPPAPYVVVSRLICPPPLGGLDIFDVFKRDACLEALSFLQEKLLLALFLGHMDLPYTETMTTMANQIRTSQLCCELIHSQIRSGDHTEIVDCFGATNAHIKIEALRCPSVFVFFFLLIFPLALPGMLAQTNPATSSKGSNKVINSLALF